MWGCCSLRGQLLNDWRHHCDQCGQNTSEMHYPYHMQVSWLTVQLLPLPASLRPEAVGIFVINIVLGVVCIFLK